MNGTDKRNGIRELIKGSRESIADTARLMHGKLRYLAKRIYGMGILRFFRKEQNIELIARYIKCAATALAGFTFGSLNILPGVYPLGFAYLIAGGRYTFFAYIGSALAALFYPSLGFAYFGVNTLIYIIRKLLLTDDFSERLRIRIFLAVGTGLFIATALFISSPMTAAYPGSSDTLLSAAGYVFAIPICVFLLYPVLGTESFSPGLVRCSLVFFCMALIASAAQLYPAVSFFIACFLTLFFCVRADRAKALMCAVLFGLSSANMLYAVSLCICAYVFTALYEKRFLAAELLFTVLQLIFLLIILPFGSSAPYAMAASTAACFLFIPVGFYLCVKQNSGTDNAPPAREAVSEAYTRRMTDLSGAFGAVSKLCYSFSGKMRFPTLQESQVLISVTALGECSRCIMKENCRKKSYWDDKGLAKELLCGKVSSGKLKSPLTDCIKRREITEAINREYTKLLTERFNNNKTEILAHEYSAIARILKYTSRMSSEDVYFDGKLTRLACVAVKKLGIRNSGTTVYGSRRKTLDISGVPVSSLNMPSEELATFLSAECGEIFASPEFIMDENGTFTVRMCSRELISASYAKAVHTKHGETVSGDTVSFFRSDDSYFYALIADGMGSGRDAAMTSRLTSVFVEKLLSGGAGKGVTMELLNSMLMSKSKECFSGVDLLELDLIKKRASFIKAGAAPTYLLRSAKLFKVSSDTPPCGIIEGFSAEDTAFEVFPGDIIIMLSDGITSSMDCGSVLCDIMNQNKGTELEAIASQIIDKAVSLCVHDDDMSCVILRIR